MQKTGKSASVKAEVSILDSSFRKSFASLAVDIGAIMMMMTMMMMMMMMMILVINLVYFRAIHHHIMTLLHNPSFS